MKSSDGKGLALTLLELGILLVDDVNAAFAANDLTIDGAFFDGSSNFHVNDFKLAKP